MTGRYLRNPNTDPSCDSIIANDRQAGIAITTVTDVAIISIKRCNINYNTTRRRRDATVPTMRTSHHPLPTDSLLQNDLWASFGSGSETRWGVGSIEIRPTHTVAGSLKAVSTVFIRKVLLKTIADFGYVRASLSCVGWHGHVERCLGGWGVIRCPATMVMQHRDNTLAE